MPAVLPVFGKKNFKKPIPKIEYQDYNQKIDMNLDFPKKMNKNFRLHIDRRVRVSEKSER